MNEVFSRDLTPFFLEKREIAKEEIDPRKIWLKTILINNNSSDLKKFIISGNYKKEDSFCLNCKSAVKHVYYLNAKKNICDLCEQTFCLDCLKKVDAMKDAKLKYIKIKLCKNCFIYINELKYKTQPNMFIDKKAIELEDNFNKISNTYTRLCSNISQLNGLLIICENNKEFCNNFSQEITLVSETIKEDIVFLNQAKKKCSSFTDTSFIFNKMGKNLTVYLKIIRNKIIPTAAETLNRANEFILS